MMRRRAVLLLTLMTVALVMVASPAWADATFIVNSTGDEGDDSLGGTCATAPVPDGFEGDCTLRAAIQEANNDASSVAVFITFDIPGSGVQTIEVGKPPAGSTTGNGPLPAITRPVVIDGYSQPGASENTKALGSNAVLLIELDGSNVSGGPGLELRTSHTTITGLVINRFGLSGISAPLTTAGDHWIRGNFIGTDPSGTKDRGNGTYGVSMSSNDNSIGGDLRARNLISGNTDSGVSLSGSDNRVNGNLIGTKKDGTTALGNGFHGVAINGSSNVVSGDTAASGNTIAFNGGDGVAVYGGTGNVIVNSSIHSNAELGIDLDSNGPTPNDGVGDADTGANNLQNFPVLSSAKTTLRATTIKGTLKSTRDGTFHIEFFSNPGSAREGKKVIGQKVVSDTDGDGIVPFTFKPPQKVKAGLFVTATATNSVTADTSEISAPKKVL